MNLFYFFREMLVGKTEYWGPANTVGSWKINLSADTNSIEFARYDVDSYVVKQIVPVPSELAESIRDKLETLTGNDRLDASAIKNIPVASDNATGFSTLPTLVWTDTTPDRTLALNGSHDIYINGTLYTKGSATVQITDVTGLHWIYYNSAGVLTVTPPASGFPGFDQCLVASVYWNSGYAKGLAANEMHGHLMDSKTHEYLHNTVGVRYNTGLTGTFGNTTFSITSGSIYDEDLKIDITTQTTIAKFYRNVAESMAWRWTAKDALPYHAGHKYDNAGTLANVGSNDYYAVWFFATNDIDHPVIAMLGQRTDTTIANARANNTYESLSFGTLPYKEMKLLYRVIFRNDATPYEETQDLRSVSNLPSGTYVATDHGVLTGLADDDHLQYPIITSQYGAPVVAPARIGAINIDPVFSQSMFYATGIASASDWRRLIPWAVDSLNTIDETETLIMSKSISAGRFYNGKLIIHCSTIDRSTVYCSEWSIAFDEDGLVGDQKATEFTRGTRGTIAVRFDLTASTLRIYVTGKAATDLIWSCFLQRFMSTTI